MTTVASQGERKRLETRTERRVLPNGAEVLVDHLPRCWNCRNPLAWHATRPWSIKCRWCHKTTSSPSE